MDVAQEELEARYAEAVSAAGARLVAAHCVSDALSDLGIVRTQDRLVVCADGAQGVFIERFPRESLFFVAAPTVEAFNAVSPAPAGEGRTFWFVESLGGRGLRVPDLRDLARAAHAAGALLVVDNTVPSSFGCQPFALGADLCLEALDRVAAGGLPHKIVALAWSGRGRQAKAAISPKIEASINSFLNQSAAFAGEDASETAIDAVDLVAIERGLDALPVRMQRTFDHARALAEYLSCCDAVPSVSYPGLASHPDHALAANVLRHGCGSIVDFELPSRVGAAAFISRCGRSGCDGPDAATRSHLSARDGGDARFIRLVAGLDDPLAIADDLDQAMRWFRNPPEP